MVDEDFRVEVIGHATLRVQCGGRTLLTDSWLVDPIVCVCLLDTTPADVTATDTNTLTVQINASGVFTLSGATVD